MGERATEKNSNGKRGAFGRISYGKDDTRDFKERKRKGIDDLM